MKNTQAKENRKPSEIDFRRLLVKLSPEQVKIVGAAIKILSESDNVPSTEELLVMATARAAAEN